MHTCGQFWNSEEVLTNQSLCRILHVSHVYTFRYVNFSRDYGFIVVFTFSFQQFVMTFAAPKCTFCVVLSGMYLNFKCFEKNFFETSPTMSSPLSYQFKMFLFVIKAFSFLAFPKQGARKCIH